MPDEHAEKQSISTIDDFDLGDLAAEHTAELAIVNPRTKLPTTWVWTFAGPGHPATRAVQNKMGMRDRAEAFAERKAVQAGRDPKIPSNDELAEVNVHRISGRVLHFTSVKLNGRQIEFSPDEAHALLKDPNYGWLWLQCYNFLNAEDSFIKASPTT